MTTRLSHTISANTNAALWNFVVRNGPAVYLSAPVALLAVRLVSLLNLLAQAIFPNMDVQFTVIARSSLPTIGRHQ